MVIMASGMASSMASGMASGITRGRVPTTTVATTESGKMTAIVQLIGWQRHAALVNWHLSNKGIS